MTGEIGCDQVRDLAPELALGIAEGHERDAALRHLSGCAACRELVSEFSAVDGELLVLAAGKDPPRGFESRVLARLAEPSRDTRPESLPRRRRWVLAAAAAAVVAAALGGGSVFWATADDRQLADSYQAVLSLGQGDFFLAAPLQGSDGRVGTVFAYQGDPSWAMVSIQPSFPEEGRFRVQVVTRDGRYLSLDDMILGGAEQAQGVQLPVDASAVQELRFAQSDGGTRFTATFDTANPWD
jgi:hypothetical protein